MRKLFALFLVVTIVSSFATFKQVFAGGPPQTADTPVQTDQKSPEVGNGVENSSPLTDENDRLVSNNETSHGPDSAHAIASRPQATSSIASGVPVLDEQREIGAESAQSRKASNSARTTPVTLSPLDTFVTTVKNGKSDAVVGVYAPQAFALQVVQQPANQPGYVSTDPNEVTQYGPATSFGTIGIVAHNFLSGGQFSSLSAGQEVDILYGNGSLRRYSVTSIRHFQALSPEDPYSSFLDLDKGGASLSSSDVFTQLYTGGNQVVLLTCIAANGNSSWGRLFVIATPIHQW